MKANPHPTPQGCTEPQIREEDLLEQLYQMTDEIDIQELAAVDRIKEEIERVQKMIASLGGHAETLIDSIPAIDAKSCAKYILKEGTKDEKRELMQHLQISLTIKSSQITRSM